MANRRQTEAWRDRTSRYKAKHPLGQKFASMKCTAKKRKVEFAMTRTTFEKWWNETLANCEYCGIPEKYIPLAFPGAPKHLLNLSVDRRDNQYGYGVGNLVKACCFCNAAKGAVFTFEEAKKIGSVIQEILIARVHG